MTKSGRMRLISANRPLFKAVGGAGLALTMALAGCASTPESVRSSDVPLVPVIETAAAMPDLQSVDYLDPDEVTNLPAGTVLIGYQVGERTALLVTYSDGELRRLPDVDSAGVLLSVGSWSAGSTEVLVGDTDPGIQPARLDLVTGELDPTDAESTDSAAAEPQSVLTGPLVMNPAGTFGVRLDDGAVLPPPMAQEYMIVDLATGQSTIRSWGGRMCSTPSWSADGIALTTVCANVSAGQVPTAADSPTRIVVDPATGGVASETPVTPGEMWPTHPVGWAASGAMTVGWPLPADKKEAAFIPNTCGDTLYRTDAGGATTEIPLPTTDEVGVTEVLAVVGDTVYLWRHRSCAEPTIGALIRVDLTAGTASTLVAETDLPGSFSAVIAR